MNTDAQLCSCLRSDDYLPKPAVPDVTYVVIADLTGY
jgi:hypothetical protein